MTIVILLAAAGITFGLQHKIPFLHKKLDLLDSMLRCTFCTGFHGGWMAYLVSSLPEATVQEAILFAFAGAMFSYSLDEFVKYIEEAKYGDDE